MHQALIDEVRRGRQNTPTDELVELYKKRSSWYGAYPAEVFEAVRQILVERGVSDASLDLSPPQTGLASQAPQASSDRAGFAIVGCLAGGLVGYLVGRALDPETLVSQLAQNFMLAGAVAGLVAGLGLASLMSNQGTRHPVLEAETICPQCSTLVPNGMQFCGKCGKALAAIVCRQCGKAVPPDQQFCGGRGTRVESA